MPHRLFAPSPCRGAEGTQAARAAAQAVDLGVLPEWDLGDLYPGLDAPEFKADLDRAERDNDPGAADRARAELEALGEELRVAAGLGGRVRKAADDRERVRKAVGEAVRRAIKDIREFDPALADHLAGGSGAAASCGTPRTRASGGRPERPADRENRGRHTKCGGRYAGCGA